MNIPTVLSKESLLDPVPPSEGAVYLPLIIFFGVLLLLGIASRFLSPSRKRFLRNYYYNSLTASILGFLYLFSRYEELGWMGSRIFLLVILVGFGLWALITTILIVRFLPRHKVMQKNENIYKKYLPKSKRK